MTSASNHVMHEPFTEAQALKAGDEWGFNCGPAAVAVALNLSLLEVRPLFAAVGFEERGFTNPTMIHAVLKAMRGSPLMRTAILFRYEPDPFPHHGIVRVQFDGPWTQKGVPPQAAYEHTHYVATQMSQLGSRFVFDLNAYGWNDHGPTGWVSYERWCEKILPLITPKRGNGGWWITHSYELRRPDPRPGETP